MRSMQVIRMKPTAAQRSVERCGRAGVRMIEDQRSACLRGPVNRGAETRDVDAACYARERVMVNNADPRCFFFVGWTAVEETSRLC